jgi:uncharacterized protein YkwD
MMRKHAYLIWSIVVAGLVLAGVIVSHWTPVKASKLKQGESESHHYLPLVSAARCAPRPLITPDDVDRDLAVETRINEIRLSRGLPSLAKDPRINQAALRHSNDMADNNFFDHVGSDGTRAGERLEGACYNWQAYGEIIAAGYKSPSSVVAAWMDSPGHRGIILDPGYADFGAGYAYKAYSRYKHYWTVDFGLLEPEPIAAPARLNKCSYHLQDADGELWISLFTSQPCDDFGDPLESNSDRE